jgi:hypothetical protein
MTKYTQRCTAMTVVPEDKPLYSEMATEVKIVDEGGGEFIEVTQTQSECGTIRIDPKEWPAIRSAINRMVVNTRKDTL